MDRLSQDQIDRLLDDIYFAAADTTGWQAVVDRLATILDGATISLQGHDFATNQHLGVLTAGFSSEAVASFRDYYAGINPWAAGMASWPVGRTMVADYFMAREDLLGTEFYNDFLRPNDDIASGVGVIAHRSRLRFVALSANIRVKDEDRHQPNAIALFDVLGPHLERAFRVSRSLGATDLAKQGAAAFDTLNDPIFLFGGSGRLLYANKAAMDPKGDVGLYVDRHSSGFRFLNEGANTRLSRAVHRLTQSGRTFPAATFSVPSADNTAIALATLAPFPMGSGRRSSFLDVGTSDRVGAVLMLETATALREKRRLLLLQLGLSQAESEVALGLCSGADIEQLAALRNTSLATIRNQVRAAFAKLGVRRQAELVARVAQLL